MQASMTGLMVVPLIELGGRSDLAVKTGREEKMLEVTSLFIKLNYYIKLRTAVTSSQKREQRKETLSKQTGNLWNGRRHL